MKLTKAIIKEAEKTIKYLSSEYLELHKNIQRFAEPHILYNGFYTFRLVDSKTNSETKILITR